MKNIHVLPTDKPSRLHLQNGNLVLHRLQYTLVAQHIYITSDEEIKEGDWFMSDFNSFPLHNIKELSEREGTLGWKQEDLKNNLRIILTTDQDLIKDGVQAIDDEFLEWFVENPSCEVVEVEHYNNQCRGECDICDNTCGNWYKIIIPKKEPKQFCEYCKIEITKYGCGCGTEKPKQETLEEVIGIKAHEYSMQYVGTDKYTVSMLAIQFGYQLAQQQNKNLYSEEEVEYLLYSFKNYLGFGEEVNEKKWFEQFKKK